MAGSGFTISLVMLQGFKYWPDFCEYLGQAELATGARFDSAAALANNAADAKQIIIAAIATETLAEWTKRFGSLQGQGGLEAER